MHSLAHQLAHPGPACHLPTVVLPCCVLLLLLLLLLLFCVHLLTAPVCPAGYYFDTATKVCVRCPQGSFCRGGDKWADQSSDANLGVEQTCNNEGGTGLTTKSTGATKSTDCGVCVCVCVCDNLPSSSCFCLVAGSICISVLCECCKGMHDLVCNSNCMHAIKPIPQAAELTWLQ
jgi:hypothetical protein